MTFTRLRFGALCAIAISLSAALPALADDASDLMAKHKAFVGFAFGDGAIGSLVLDGTTTNKQKNTLVETLHEVHRGIAERTTATDVADKTSRDEGFTGRLYWEIQSANGFINPIVGERQKYAIASDLLFNEATALMSAQSLGSRSLENTSYPVLRLSMPASDPIDVYVDPQTGAFKRAVIDPGGSYEDTIDILAYASAGSGKKIISKWSRPGSKFTHEWTKIAANAPVSDDALHPPIYPSPWTFGSGKPFAFQYKDSDFQGRGIYITASINGVPGRFKLDTGAYDILLTQKFAEKAHVQHIGHTTGGGFGPMEIHPNVDKIHTLQVGDNVMTDFKATSADTDLGEETDGLFGFDFLAGAIVTLDMDNHLMTIADPHTAVDKTKGVNVLVDLNGGQPHIPMKINGKTDAEVMLDSGNEFNVIFAKDLMTKYGVNMLIDPDPEKYLNSHAAIRGVGGIGVVECGSLDSLAVGPIVYQNTQACTTTGMQGHDANVGIDFIRQFNIVFDYPESLMIMTPRKQ